MRPNNLTRLSNISTIRTISPDELIPNVDNDENTPPKGENGDQLKKNLIQNTSSPIKNLEQLPTNKEIDFENRTPQKVMHPNMNDDEKDTENFNSSKNENANEFDSGNPEGCGRLISIKGKGRQIIKFDPKVDKLVKTEDLDQICLENFTKEEIFEALCEVKQENREIKGMLTKISEKYL